MKPVSKMARRPMVAASVAVVLLLGGCVEARYTAPDPVPVELLPSYKQDTNPEIPARIHVVTFVVQSVDAPYSDSGKDRFRLFQSSNIPKQLYEIMGRWRAFREVSRVTAPAPGAADYTVSGTLDYKENRVRAPYYHEINVKGVLRVRVARAGDGVLILDKDFVDDQTDSASSFQPIRVLYLQEAFFQKIAAEIRKTVEGDVRQAGAAGAPPK